MTLTTALATHDDAALEALTSKGLLRRARRDHEAGRASVVRASEGAAEVLADGQSVTMDEGGPSAAMCTCRATGVCRHVLLAVLALRDHVGVNDEDKSGSRSAVDELCALREDELRKFAGADWEKAVALVAGHEPVELIHDGRSLTVKLSELGASVTFVAGRGLKNAIYKGAKTRKRLSITAGTLLLREREGISAPRVGGPKQSGSPAATREFFEKTQTAIERAVSAVLPARSAMAHDLLLDLAISTRVEALPRLSSELRGLARQAQLASVRDIAFEADLFLGSAARTYALLEALKATPDKLTYTGSIRRDYQPREPFDLWMLGAAGWRSKAGARGVTAYLYAPSERTWFTVTEARAAGTDPRFDPANVYRGALWGAGTLQGLMGRTIHLPKPMVAADGSISSSLPERGRMSETRVSVSDLVDEMAPEKQQWSALRHDLARRFGSGLGRSAMPVPALIAPSGFRGFDFNDLEQVYEWEAIDESGDALILSIRGSEHETARRLRQMGRKIRALVVEVSFGVHGVIHRPVAVVSKAKTGLQLHNIDFDPWPVQRGIGKTLGKLEDVLAASTKPPMRTVDPLRLLISDALDAIVGVLGSSKTEELGEIRSRCEASGLVSLAKAIEATQETPTVKSALKAGYIAAELDTALLLES